MSDADAQFKSERAHQLFVERETNVHKRTDRLFAILMVIQWLGGIAAALLISPRTWAGQESQVHVHVWMAIFLGGLIASFPVYLAWKMPGHTVTRHAVAIAQMLFSALLIDISGGRIETHFHIFGSLAFLAFYRDRKVLLSATVVVALDHFFRGMFWPQSVFGVAATGNWRWLEHAGWVLFENAFLWVSIRQSLEEAHDLADQQASLEMTNVRIEHRVAERTAELTNEIGEREKAEHALRESQLLYHALVEELPICVYRKDSAGRFVFVNSQFCKLKTLTETQILKTAAIDSDVGNDAHHAAIMQTGLPIETEEFYPESTGAMRYFQVVRLPVLDGNGRVTGSQGVYFDVTSRKQAEEKLQQLHTQLVDASRQAGMADVATNVLHNVGNVLNSVNVSGLLIADKMKSSRLPNVSKLADLINSQKSDLPNFFAKDSRAAQLPDYLTNLSKHLEQEHGGILEEIALLVEKIDHIKDIVGMQQSYARSGGVLESLKASELVEDALRLNGAAMTRHKVAIVKEFADVPPVTTDKHKVLQILVNLLRNAKYACDDSGKDDKQINLRITNGDDFVRITVMDNGIGIPTENLTRIFNHGFTTRRDGHGFGLHSGALAAREIGGRLVATSEGMGKGATFTLELPVKHEERDYEQQCLNQ